MGKPDWFLLMSAWVKEGHGERGITLPFLVGAIALSRQNENPTIQDARTLLDEMITQPVHEHVVEIAWCSSLAAPILTANAAPSPFQPQVGFQFPGGKEMCVVFGLDLQDRWKSSDPIVLVDSLLDESELAISDRMFSRDPNSKTYKAFERWEKGFIEQVLPSGG